MKFFLTLKLMLLSGLLALAQNREALEPAEKSDFQNATANQHLLDVYEKKPEDWPDETLLPIAICYARNGNFATSEKLYRKFLIKQPTSTRGIRGLGNCLALQKNFEGAIEQFRKAWALKDVPSLAQLGFILILQSRWDEVDILVPDLVANRKQDVGIINCLIAVAMVREPINKVLFYQAIEGIPDEVLMKRDDTRESVLKALEIFGDETRIKQLKAKIPPAT